MYSTENYIQYTMRNQNETEYFLKECIYRAGPKRSFGFFHNILRKNSNELFGQPSLCITESLFAVEQKFFKLIFIGV